MAFAEDYVSVAERLGLFREKHPEGCLQPADLNVPYRIEEIGAQTFIVYTAAAFRTPDDPRPGIGIAWEEVPGKTNFTRGSELMNAETSAWGRAIVAALAADTKRDGRIASREEVESRSGDHDGAPSSTGPKDRPALKPQLDRTKQAVKDAKIQGWVDDQGFGWPWSIAACEAIEAQAAEALTAPFASAPSDTRDLAEYPADSF